MLKFSKHSKNIVKLLFAQKYGAKNLRGGIEIMDRGGVMWDWELGEVKIVKVGTVES